jgi:small multidrug resistance pump
MPVPAVPKLLPVARDGTGGRRPATLATVGTVSPCRQDYVDPVRKWAFLAAAIVTEVAATLSLRASQDHSVWLVAVVVGYLLAFTLLTLVLREGIPVGVTYGLWGASGTALTALLAAVIFRDPFTWPIALGIGLIIAGVLFIEFGSRQRELTPETTP